MDWRCCRRFATESRHPACSRRASRPAVVSERPHGFGEGELRRPVYLAASHELARKPPPGEDARREQARRPLSTATTDNAARQERDSRRNGVARNNSLRSIPIFRVRNAGTGGLPVISRSNWHSPSPPPSSAAAAVSTRRIPAEAVAGFRRRACHTGRS
jgi:hypothetical protein